MNADKALPELQRLSSYLHVSDFIIDFLRGLAYMIIKGELWLSDQVYSAVGGVYKYLNLYQFLDPKFSQFIKPFGSFVLLISIGFIAVQLLRGKLKEVGDAPMNVLMVGIILLMMPSITSTLIGLVSPAQTAVSSSFKNPAQTVFRSTVTDLYVMGDKNWDTKKTAGVDGNNLTSSSLNYMNITEKITEPSDVKNGDILDYQIGIPKEPQKGKVLEATKMDHGNGIMNDLTGNMFGHFYYRYSWHPIIVAILIALIAVAGILTGVRSAMLIYQLAREYLLAPVALWAKLNTLEVARSFLTGIAGATVSLIFAAYNYYIYGLAIGYVVNETNLLTELFLIAGFTFASLDSPIILQKAFGVDAGLKSTAGAIAGGIFAGKMAASSVKNGATAAAGLAVGGAEKLAFAGGLLNGGSKASAEGLADALANNKKNDSQQTTPLGDQLDNKNKPENQSSGKSGNATNIPPETKEKQDNQNDKAKEQEPNSQASEKMSSDNDETTPATAPDSDTDMEGINDNQDSSESSEETPDTSDTSSATGDMGDLSDNAAPDTDEVPEQTDSVTSPDDNVEPDTKGVPESEESVGEPDTSGVNSSSDDDTTPAEDDQSAVQPDTNAPNVGETKSDLERNQQIAEENRQSPETSDHLTSHPEARNPLTAAAHDYLSTPKSERHAAGSFDRVRNAYRAGNNLGEDFAKYGNQKRQDNTDFKKYRKTIKDFRKYGK